ncbi:MAG: hypothetical protein ABDH18_00365 [Aquificaceae bacterium]
MLNRREILLKLGIGALLSACGGGGGSSGTPAIGNSQANTGSPAPAGGTSGTSQGGTGSSSGGSSTAGGSQGGTRGSGGGSGTTGGSQGGGGSSGPLSIKFGLGDDPERMINGYDPNGEMVLRRLNPQIVCFWLNGGRDSSGRITGSSMSFIRNWANARRFEEWSRAGYEIMLITWENYDGQNPGLGARTNGDYHTSEDFIRDLREILQILRDQVNTKTYIVLATEQSTYTACRQDSSCPHRIPHTDVISDQTRNYFSALRANLLRAIDEIRRILPNSDFGTCFGGWLVEFPEGIEFIRFFEPVINASNAVFFQSMMDFKASERGGYGNPQRILRNCEFYSSYRKPIHLAHYMPNNHRADVVADDARQMTNAEYLRRLHSLGLRSFSFMYYGTVKDNRFNSLDELSRLRNLMRSF